MRKAHTSAYFIKIIESLTQNQKVIESHFYTQQSISVPSNTGKKCTEAYYIPNKIKKKYGMTCLGPKCNTGVT
jgi:hypothetical protein